MDSQNYDVLIKGNVKKLSSCNYNYMFNMENGNMAVWGVTPDHDPDYCPYGPTIFDAEVTDKCSGLNNKPCAWCYKANNPQGQIGNMSFETFKRVFDQLPKTLTQIAFGADAQCKANPDIWKMMEYCRENNVIPNITVADVDEETAQKLAKYCGAVAVSYYGFVHKHTFRRSLENLKDAGIKQLNCHVLLSKETKEWVHELIYDWDSHPSTPLDREFTGYNEYLNAIVGLAVKNCGRGKNYTRLTQFEYTSVIEKFLQKNIPFGSDSCGCNKLIKAFEVLEKKIPTMLLQPCESACESFYCNAAGIYYPCSFNETEEYGIDSKDVKDFVKDVWFSEKIKKFRTKLFENNRDCPSYKI